MGSREKKKSKEHFFLDYLSSFHLCFLVFFFDPLRTLCCFLSVSAFFIVLKIKRVVKLKRILLLLLLFKFFCFPFFLLVHMRLLRQRE